MAILSKEEQQEAKEEMEYQEEMREGRERRSRHEASESPAEERAEHRPRPRLSKREREIAQEELEYAYPDEPPVERKVGKNVRSEYLEELEYADAIDADTPITLHGKGNLVHPSVMPDYMEELEYASAVHIGSSTGRLAPDVRPDYLDELAYSYDIGASRREKAGGLFFDLGFTRADLVSTGKGVRGMFSNIGTSIGHIPQMSSQELFGSIGSARDALYSNVRPTRGRKGRVSPIGSNVNFFRGAPSMMTMDPFRISGPQQPLVKRGKGSRSKSQNILEGGIPDSLSWMF